MAVAESFVQWNYFDSTLKGNGQPESAGFELAVVKLTAANVVAQEALIDTLTASIEAIVLGNLNKTTIVWEREIISAVAANDQLAQRGIKLLCRYHDASVPTNKYHVSIPTFDLSLLPLHSEFLDLADAGVGEAFKDAFEAVVRAKDDDTHVVILDSAQYID